MAETTSPTAPQEMHDEVLQRENIEETLTTEDPSGIVLNDDDAPTVTPSETEFQSEASAATPISTSETTSTDIVDAKTSIAAASGGGATVSPTVQSLSSDQDVGALKEQQHHGEGNARGAVAVSHNRTPTAPLGSPETTSEVTTTDAAVDAITTAQLVTDTIDDEERAQLIRDVRHTMTAEATTAQLVNIVASGDGTAVAAAAGGGATNNASANAVKGNTSEETTAPKQSQKMKLMILLAVAILILIAIIVGSVVATRGNDGSAADVVATRNNNNNDSSAADTDIVDPVSVNDDSLPFSDTSELHDAVELYLSMKANDTLRDTSDVALKYGYPMGTWDVSRLTNFSRVFDPERSEVLDSLREPSVYNEALTEDLSGWDMSNADTLVGMFAATKNFQGFGLDAWDVSRVTDFSFCFAFAEGFNQSSISTWNTSSAVLMDGMFLGATGFTSGVGNFDVSNVESMAYMFQYAILFNEDLTSWDVSNVINMNSLFSSAQGFNGDVSTWNTGKVFDMSQTFFDTSVFNGNLSSWDVSNVQYMFYTFGGAFEFEGGDLTLWDTSRVIDMVGLFYIGANFTGNISTWDVSKVTSFGVTFAQAAEFNSDVSQWDTSSATDFTYMFADAPEFAGDVSEWKTSKVESMFAMFGNAKKFNSDVSGWNVSSLSDGIRMFDGAFLFNYSLCAWSRSIPSNASVDDMFNKTSCPELGTPILDDTVPGPFCYVCTEDDFKSLK